MSASFRRSARGRVGPEEDAEAEGRQPRGTVVEKAGCVAVEGTGGQSEGGGGSERGLRGGLRAGSGGPAPSTEGAKLWSGRFAGASEIPGGGQVVSGGWRAPVGPLAKSTVKSGCRPVTPPGGLVVTRM